MANIASPRLLVEYIYLDCPGIESLYAQIVDCLETSHVTTTQKSTGAKAGGALRLKNFLIKMLSGVEGEVSAEVTGSRTSTEQSTSVQTIEQKLSKVLAFLKESGEDHFFTDLGEASRHVQDKGVAVFVNVHDKFNAPQFSGGGIGTDLVNASGYLVLEKGGAADYDYRDDCYKHPTAPITLSAGIKKMRGGGVMAITSHEAIFIRRLGGRHVPLCIFGSLNGTSEFLQIKPFAIWK